jgi:hypothetical protein
MIRTAKRVLASTADITPALVVEIEKPTCRKHKNTCELGHEGEQLAKCKWHVSRCRAS